MKLKQGTYSPIDFILVLVWTRAFFFLGDTCVSAFFQSGVTWTSASHWTGLWGCSSASWCASVSVSFVWIMSDKSCETTYRECWFVLIIMNPNNNKKNLLYVSRFSLADLFFFEEPASARDELLNALFSWKTVATTWSSLRKKWHLSSLRSLKQSRNSIIFEPLTLLHTHLWSQLWVSFEAAAVKVFCRSRYTLSVPPVTSR